MVQLTPEELLRFYSVGGESIWRVKCRGLPDDCRVVDIIFDKLSQMVKICLETERSDRFYATAVAQHPPNADIYSEVEFIGTSNSLARSQCPTVSSGYSNEP